MSDPARPDELSATLRRLRHEAGLSEAEAAQRARLTQSKVSRIETARQMPTADEVERLCEAYEVPIRAKRALVAVTEDIREQITPTRTVLHRHGAPRIQERIGRIEAASARLRSFHPALVIGLLQTPDYSRALLSGAYTRADLDRMVSARMARQSVLDTHRAFELLMTEGALRWHVGGRLVMAEQIEHLARASERPNVRIGIIPWTRPVTHPVLHGFHIYDQRAVMVSTETAIATMTDRLQVADFEARFSLYAELADWDDDARPVFERLAREYRNLDQT
ncbi:MAG: helix-turn-helix domain-containing protein [Pseudonocardiaceae bacterium]